VEAGPDPVGAIDAPVAESPQWTSGGRASTLVSADNHPDLAVSQRKAPRMTVLISTRDVPARQRHDAWRRIVCDTLGPLDMRIDPGTPLSGKIEAGRLGSVGVGKIQTSTPHSVHRTPG
jgi:hypothetical protein